jgi:hypothetical protein
VAVFLLSFDLVVERCAEVLQSFGVLAFVQHYLIYNNQELGGPVLVELAAKVFVGVERDIILKDRFQEVEESGFTRVAFLRHEKKNGELLEWTGIEQLDIVHPQFVLLLKDMMYECVYMNEGTFGGDVVDRLVLVVEVADNPFVVDVIWHNAEAIILRDIDDILLGFILSDGSV